MKLNNIRKTKVISSFFSSKNDSDKRTRLTDDNYFHLSCILAPLVNSRDNIGACIFTLWLIVEELGVVWHIFDSP